ncbi:conserved hypothetical protein [Candidatus Methylobacter favarea]|uniref:Photosynthesis system II assembly factor Ycf48/Hcf136-like domain-containing protein n=2 Tax=Candidatus Methylobacter favarea TaxID=2707345 RepID=A0A8S0WI70_9GAMM|nr:conserved hypothetical protein [Candidatus Methylobacter favarea]
MNRIMPVLEHSTTKYNAKVLICICLLLAGGFAGTAKAGINKWTAIGPGGGGSINTLAIDPSDPMTLYAGSGDNSFIFMSTRDGGVFKSTDGGANWHAVGTGLPGFFDVRAIVIDPLKPSTVYAAGGGRLYKSTDSGASWQAVNTGLSGLAITTLVIDPLNPLTLYAGGYGGVFKTTNGGVSWQAVNAGLGNRTSLNGLSDVFVSVLVIDPLNPATLYAGNNGSVDDSISGVYKSTNGGASWQAANIGLPDSVSAIAIDPLNPLTLYAGGYGGVFNTTNGGASWQAVNTGLPFNSSVSALEIDPFNPSVIFAIVQDELGATVAFKTANGGARWQEVSRELPSYSSISALEIDPLNPATLYAGGEGVFKTADSGASWQAINIGLNNLTVSNVAIDPVNSDILFAGIDAYYKDPLNVTLFKSTDKGDTWQAVTGIGRAPIIEFDPLNPTILYAGSSHLGSSSGSVFKSTDSGASWQALSTEPPLVFGVNAIAIDPTNSSTLYASSASQIYGRYGVFKTTNGGASWQAVNTGLTSLDVNELAIDPVDSATLYAGTGGGVFKSSNGGASWQAVNSGLASLGVNELAIDPVDSATLYAGTGGGVFKSSNGGASWHAINTGLPPDSFISAILIDPLNPAMLYVGTNGGDVLSHESGDVYQSANGGASWQVVNNGLPSNPGVNVLAIDPLDGATLYAGTHGHSVFKITFKTLGDIDQDGDIDRSDLARITAALNQPADGPDDLRDLNGDLSIDALDARKLVLLCTQPQCAMSSPNR